MHLNYKRDTYLIKTNSPYDFYPGLINIDWLFWVTSYVYENYFTFSTAFSSVFSAQKKESQLKFWKKFKFKLRNYLSYLYIYFTAQCQYFFHNSVSALGVSVFFQTQWKETDFMYDRCIDSYKIEIGKHYWCHYLQFKKFIRVRIGSNKISQNQLLSLQKCIGLLNFLIASTVWLE